MPYREPWFRTATADQTRAIEAANWRRSTEAAIFRANNDAAERGSIGEIIARYNAASSRNPLAPVPPPDDEGGGIGGALKSVVGKVADIARSGPVQATGIPNAIEDVITTYSRTKQATLGALTADTPIESVIQAYEGAAGKHEFSPQDLGFVRLMPEGSTERQVTGDILGRLVDPLSLGTAGFGASVRLGEIGADVAGPLAREAAKSAGLGEVGQAVADVAGSVVGGAAAVGALKGARALDQMSVDEVIDSYTRGAERSTPGVLSQLATEEPGVYLPATTRTLGGGAEASDDAANAARKFTAWVNAEGQLRESGQAGAEVSAGRAAQLKQAEEAFGRAMQEGRPGDALSEASAAARVGRLRTTLGDIEPLSDSEWSAIRADVADKVASGSSRSGIDAITMNHAVQKARAIQDWVAGGRQGPTPAGLFDSERRLLAQYGYGDMADATQSAITAASGGGGRGRPRPTAMGAGGGGRATPPPASAARRMAERATASAEREANAAAKELRSAEIAREQARQDAFAGAEKSRAAAQRRISAAPSVASAPPKSQALKAAYAREKESADALLTSALQKVGGKDRAKARDFIIRWADDNRTLLDGVNGDPSAVRAAFEGSFDDPWLTQAVIRRNMVTDFLERTDAVESADDARAVAEMLFRRELNMRYPKGVPTEINDALKNAASVPFEQSMQAIDVFKKRAQNTQFGLLDFAIVGQQEWNAVRRNPAQIVAGAINRGLNHIGLGVDVMQPGVVDKQVQYALDGLASGMTRTGMTQTYDDVGSLLSYLGKPGRSVDKTIAPLVDKVTDIQFGRILGTTREIDHEGNLVLLKLLGKDITDPAVRRSSAQMANHATSVAQRALTKSRGQWEQRLLVSPMMTRARVANITDAAKLIRPSASAEERALAALTVAGTVTTTLAMGAALHHAIGAPGADFVLDPTAPGFGTVTTKYKNRDGKNIIIDFIPQDAVDRAFAKSLRALSESDWPSVAKALSQPLIGSASIISKVPMELAGVGYQPGQGYRFGDLPRGAGETLRRLAPVPPITESVFGERTGPVQSSLETLGIGTYPESATGALSRVTGAKFSDLPRSEQDIILQQNPELARQRSQEIIARGGPYGEYEQIKQRYAEEQAAADSKIADPQAWKDDYRARQQRLAGARAAIFGDSESDLTTPQGQYYAAIRLNTDASGAVNWDAVERWRSGLDDNTNAAIDSETGVGGATPRVRAYRAASKALAAGGYYDLADTLWADLKLRDPSRLGSFDSPDEYTAWLTDSLAKRLISGGMDSGLAYARAAQQAQSSDVAQAMELGLRGRRVRWIAEHQDEARAGITAGLISPSLANLRSAIR